MVGEMGDVVWEGSVCEGGFRRHSGDGNARMYL